MGRRGAAKAVGFAPLSRSSFVRTTISRTRSQWRLLLAVAAVATLASVLVTSLSLLISATEQGGVRGALVALPPAQRSLEVRLVDPTVALDKARAGVMDAVGSVLGDEVPAESAGRALSPVESVAWETAQPTLTYFGELDGIDSRSTLVDGAWPQSVPVDGAPIDVALPAVAAAALSVDVGGTVDVRVDDETVAAHVVGLYDAADATDSYWDVDRLAGRGYDAAFPDPTVSFYRATTLFGPLVVAPGALDEAQIPVAFLDLHVTPDFFAVTVAGLQPLLERLSAADDDIPLDSGSVAQQIFYDSDVVDSVSAVASGLVVTRSTVVVVTLLLAVLAIAALGQVARVFLDARTGERQLMQARGASRGQVFVITLLEAGLIAVAIAAVTPPLASLVYRIIALQPAMRAAGMPVDAGIPPVTWLIAAAIAVVFVVVLVAPLLRRSHSFVEGEQSAGRQRATSGIMHSGIDVALVALAAIAYWQLQSYRTPVQSTATLAIDPVLVAGPALALSAAALVCVRLIPAASRVFERIGAGTRGSIAALAAWEIGRRSQRATAAVLLLSLTLGVGTFGLVFLTTWKQSQLDQAALAVGAPVRVEAVDEDGRAQSVTLSEGAEKAPQPAIRRSAAVTLSAADAADAGSQAISVQVLALTDTAASFLAAGRTGEVGGGNIDRALQEPVDASRGIELPGGAGGVTATIQIADLPAPLAGAVVDIGAVIEQPNGLLSVVSLGQVEVDGLEHRMAETARGPSAGASSAGRLVGLQARFSTLGEEPISADASGTSANLLVKDLAWTDPSGAVQPLSAPQDSPWVGVSSDRGAPAPETTGVPEGWQLRLAVFLPPELAYQKASFSLVGWSPNSVVPAILTREFARSMNVEGSTVLGLRTGGVPAGIRIDGLTPLVPGAAATSDLIGATTSLGAGAARAETVVVDYPRLARTLVEGGASGSLVDEWWVDVPSGASAGYIDSLPDDQKASATSGALLGTQLQQAPLRVATQAALWVAIAASAALAAVGFGVQSASSLRARRLELAQLRAIGFSRRRLVAVIAVESVLMSVLGSVFGVGIGLLLALLVGPLVAVSPTGIPPVPSVIVEIPTWGLVVLVLTVVATLTVVVAVVANVQRFTEPSHLLREGAQA